MHIEFTEQEMRYVIAEPFKWQIEQDAPKGVKESIKRKLSMLDNQKIGPSGRKNVRR